MPRAEAPRQDGQFEATIENFDRTLLIDTWRKTFDVGGKHHTKTIRDEGTVDWIADSVQRCYRARASESAVAGTALHRIVREHAFMDCNHRTGWATCRALMGAAGFLPCLSNEEIISFVRSIDRDELDEQTVREWVGRAFRRLTESSEDR